MTVSAVPEDLPDHQSARPDRSLLPAWQTGTCVVAAPGSGPGAWAGAPSAVLLDGVHYLAYRLRRPIQEGRGFANVLARSVDGVEFQTLFGVDKERFGAESLERPALVVTPEGRWRLYVSCATPGTKHWRVDLLEADTVEGLATATPVTVLPGDGHVGVKDPVILHTEGRWHLWASCHPLDDPDATDRMTTDYAVSDDGVAWQWRGTVLGGRPGRWDARGVRATSVVADGSRATMLYDGRASALENWEERTGIAIGTVTEDVSGRTLFGPFTAVGDTPAATAPHGSGALRYVSVVVDRQGNRRAYYEAAMPDGAHELRTELLGPPQAAASPAERLIPHPLPSDAAL